MKSVVIAAVMMMFATQAVEAQPHRKDIHRKQYSQQQRIKQGVHSGSLTHREAAGLRMQQAKVRNYKQMAMADGRITHAERKLIQHTQYRAGRNIYNQKHDRHRRCR